ncbi:MAG: AI-2E family transporter [Capsulimonadaceae bacterium]
MDKWLRLLVILSSFLVMFVLIGLILHVLGRIAHTLVLFGMGTLLAYALDPLVEKLRTVRLPASDRTLSRGASVAAVVLGFLLGSVVACWALSGFVSRQVATLQADLPMYRNELTAKAGQLDVWLAHRHIRFSVRDSIAHPPHQFVEFGARVAGEILPLLAHFAATMAESVIVLLVAVYMLVYSAEMRERFNAKLDPDLRPRAEAWQTDVNRILGGFVRGQLAIAVVMGLCAALVCLGVGIRLWLLIGLIVVGAALIPVFGPYIGVIPAVLAALVGPTHFHNPVAAAVTVTVLFVLFNEAGSKWLYPKLVGGALGLHEVLVLFVLFAGLEVGGVLGVLFAAPLTALAFVSVVHLYRYWQQIPDMPLAVLPTTKVPVSSERLVRHSRH